MKLEERDPKVQPAVPELTDYEKSVIAQMTVFKDFPKKTILVKEGETPTSCYYVITGCVRKYLIKDGIEKTIEFFTENDSLATTNHANEQQANYYLECIEDCKLSVITSSQEKKLYQLFPRFQELCRISTEKLLTETQERFAKFISSSPTERYKDLVDNRPDLLYRVPQYQLASYLGITPESLSRIRKRIAKN